jgi:integrase/recombinase XerC
VWFDNFMSITRSEARDPLARAQRLHEWGEAALRRFATEAAAARDPERLWQLTESHLTLHGAGGVTTSRHTLRAYRRGIVELMALWEGESVLRPSRDAAALYVARLRAGDREPIHLQTDGDRPGRRPKKGPLAPATVELRLAAARALYAALRWAGATEADPFRDVKGAREATRAEDVANLNVYTEYEIIDLLGTADDGEDRVIVLLGAHGGLRVSEMLALAWDDVDVAGREILVREGKGGKTALVALSPKLAAELEQHRRERLAKGPFSPLVLTLRSQYGIYRRLRLLCERAHVRFKGIHALRHAAGTRLYRQTGDLGQVQDHLRHATLDMARRYARSDRRKLRTTLDDWG